MFEFDVFLIQNLDESPGGYFETLSCTFLLMADKENITGLEVARKTISITSIPHLHSQIKHRTTKDKPRFHICL